jgi:hypothetical protein
MPEESAIEPELEGLQEEARRAVEESPDLQGRIRELTRSAISDGPPDLARIRQVTRAVLDGVSEAAERETGETKQAIRQSLGGVEEALLHVAEASSLALQEAQGRASEFSDRDLKRATDELRDLGAALRGTLGDLAHAGKSTLSGVLDDLLGHARASGGDFGQRLKASLGELQGRLPGSGQETVNAGVQTARSAADLMTQVTSGILIGLGEGLRNRPSRDAEHPPKQAGPD